jgi:hypothetical protein
MFGYLRPSICEPRPPVLQIEKNKPLEEVYCTKNDGVDYILYVYLFVKVCSVYTKATSPNNKSF